MAVNETLDVSSIIFGSSCDDGEMEADLAASAASYTDSCREFAPEQVEGYIAEWQLTATNKKTIRTPAFNAGPDGLFISIPLKRSE